MSRWLCRHNPLVLALLLSFNAVVVQAQTPPPYLADIRLHTAVELSQLLQRADVLYSQGQLADDAAAPITFILHGEEGRAFLQNNYQQHHMLVDLAAKLTALNIVQIRVCKTWLGSQGLMPEQLVPFVGTVENGPRAVSEFKQQPYRFF
ncbi:hypothetical protein SIN8267_02936 [Sinobacterium norvegicum]|uniref:Acyl-CoA transferase n=1 Tax=Sinobacterium norvegicum TaxID=1641715 RepID=A0ABN8ENF0_9GAMM|nr:hypothetical protein [Sinobacterium norvegicum]CAH0992799.1 hypothetical protein SIN8267_02936 [Sinobacterium norvegicum]